jgi:ribosomal protein S13
VSQEVMILQHLKDNGSITPLEALQQIGCYRLAARIMELRVKGHQIKTKFQQKNGKRFAVYQLINAA